ncbi:MAG: TonB-dependent receptor, partial [Methylophilaceae bacterium]
MLKAKFRLPTITLQILSIVLALFAPHMTWAVSTDSNIETSLIDTPLEKLVETEVITAAKIARQVSNAPSAVSIVTAEDIKNYGYQTLADVIASM